MEKIGSIITASFIMVCCLIPGLSFGRNLIQEQKNIQGSALRSSDFISISEAEKILERPAHLKDSLWKLTDGYLRYQFNYKANSKDSITGEVASLFFGLEEYKQASDAVRAYSLIKKENEKSSTVNDLKQIGDEGFLAKDALNFPFILIRKDKRIFKFKLHHVAGNTSLNELQSIAKKIAAVW